MNFTKRSLLIKEIELLLGSQLVDVELDPEHYHVAVSIAIDRLRQRTDSAVAEEDLFLTLEPDVTEYKLPDEVQEVRRLHRRGVGAYTNGGINFDPVDAAFYNTYLLQGAGTGGLATWDLYNQYLETVERQFASQFNFVWSSTSKVLRLLRKVRAQEEVLVTVWTARSEDSLLTDIYIKPWVRSYATAICKQILGQGRGKFTSGFAGPNGTVTLNGDSLLQQAQAEMDKLDLELNNRYTGGRGYGFIIG